MKDVKISNDIIYILELMTKTLIYLKINIKFQMESHIIHM